MRVMNTRFSIIRFLLYTAFSYALYKSTASMGWEFLSTIFKWIFYMHIGLAVLILGIFLLILLFGIGAVFIARRKMSIRKPASQNKKNPVMDAKYTIKE